MSSQREKTVYEVITEFLLFLKTKGLSESTIENRNFCLKYFMNFTKNKEIKYIKQVDIKVIKKFIVYLNKYKGYYSDSRINSYLGSVKSFCKYLLEYEYIQQDIASVIAYRKIKKGIKRVPETEQINCLLDVIDNSTHTGKRDKSIIELFYSTGIRRQELINLNINHIDLQNATLTVIQGKFRKDRVVPIGQKAIEQLKLYLTQARQQFPDSSNDCALYLSSWGDRINKWIIYRIFKRYNALAGLNIKITPHTLRHACATHMLQRGAGLRYIQELLGHKYLSTTQIYTHMANSDLHKAHKLYHPRGKLSLQDYSQ